MNLRRYSIKTTINLLRTNHSDTSTRFFEFIRFCIKSTDALQGGIFLVNTDEEEQKQNMEELKATREDMERREQELLNEIKELNYKMYAVDFKIKTLIKN